VWVGQVKLCDCSLTRVTPECFRDDCHTQCEVLCKHSVYFLNLLCKSTVVYSSDDPFAVLSNIYICEHTL